MKYYVSLFVLIITNVTCFCQRGKFITNSTIGGSVGTATYYGDLSPYRYPFRGLFKSTSFNSALCYTREINERRAHKLSLHFTELRGSDFKYNSSKITIVPNLIRGVHFRNRSIQLDFQETFYLLRNQSTIDRRRNTFLPYLAMGVGILTNNPKAREPFENEKGNWVSLRLLSTHGKSNKYSYIIPYIPLSLGINIKITKRLDFKVQGNINYCFSDFLDDVSETPYLNAEGFSNSVTSAFHNRIHESTDALTGQDRKSIEINGLSITEYPTPKFRGSNSSIFSKFDTSITTEFGIIYWLDWKIR